MGVSSSGPRARIDGLGAGQAAVLSLLAMGYKNHEIADQMGLSRGAVQKRLQNLRRRVKAPSRLELAVWYTKLRLQAELEERKTKWT